MSFSKRHLALFCLLIITLGLACRPSTINRENYLKSGDKIIFARHETEALLSNKQLFETLWGSNLYPRGGTIDTSSLRLVVDSLLMDTLVGIVADIDVNLVDHYHQFWSYRMRYQDALLGSYFKKHIYSKIEVDTAMVKEHLLANEKTFSLPGQVFFYHILIAPRWFADGPEAEQYKSLTEDQLAVEMEKYAYELYEAIRNGEQFEAIAVEFSHDKTTLREGGLLGWSPRGRYPDPFDSIAFVAELNVVQPPYLDEDGWHIIEVRDKVEEGPLPIDRPEFYNRVRQDLIARIAGEASQLIIDSLRRDLEITFIDSVLELDVYRSDVQTIAAVINGVDSIDFNELRNYELDYRRNYGVRNSTPEIKKQMISRLANRYVIIQAARFEKLDSVPEMMATEYFLRHENTRSIILSSRYDPAYRPSDSLIEAYYNANRNDFFIERPVRIQQITVADSILAEFAKDQASAGVSLASLIELYSSDDPAQAMILDTAININQSDVSTKLWLTANQTPIGSVSDIYEIEGGYQFIKVLERNLSLDLNRAHGKIVSILLAKYNFDSVKAFTDSLSVRFEVTQPTELTPIHLRPSIQRQNVVL